MQKSLRELLRNDPLRMAGATAFFTTFALPPILIIIIQLLGLFINPHTIRTSLLERIAAILGKNGAQQIRQILENMNQLSKNWYVILIGFIFLLFVATTLFNIIKNSLNQIWNIGLEERPGLLFSLKTRARSAVIILLSGVLFSIGLITEAIQAFLGNHINYYLPGAGGYFNSFLNEVFFIAIITAWFYLLFRYLSNGRPDAKVTLTGSFFTALLFTVGKIIVRLMLSLSNIRTVYGTSGSIVIIMLFVFYSALIFYYGGCFIKVLSQSGNHFIRPLKKAYRYELKAVKESGESKKV